MWGSILFSWNFFAALKVTLRAKGLTRYEHGGGIYIHGLDFDIDTLKATP